MSETPQQDHNLQKLVTFSTDKCDTKSLHGVRLLPDGRVLITSQKDKSLYLFNTEGEQEKLVSLPGNPFDVTMISDSQAAVTYDTGPHYGVCIIDINNMTIRQQDLIRGREYMGVHGITSLGDRLFVACYNKILVINAEGGLIKEIKTRKQDFGSRYITAVSNTKLCYTNCTDYSVVCMDIDGKVVFTYKHKDLKEPRGITSDSNGVIYVAGGPSNKVYQISPSGQLMKIILCKEDGIVNPLAIFYDRKDNKLVLTHAVSKISVYQMK